MKYALTQGGNEKACYSEPLERNCARTILFTLLHDIPDIFGQAGTDGFNIIIIEKRLHKSGSEVAVNGRAGKECNAFLDGGVVNSGT